MNKYRTHNCSELSEKEIDKVQSLVGCIEKETMEIYLDLRDHYGITQCN